MIKRGTATILWFVTAWVMVSTLDFAVGLPFWLAPVAATAAAALVAIDPRHLFWPAKPVDRQTVTRN
jgi:hypothetical protein